MRTRRRNNQRGRGKSEETKKKEEERKRSETRETWWIRKRNLLIESRSSSVLYEQWSYAGFFNWIKDPENQKKYNEFIIFCDKVPLIIASGIFRT